MINDSDIKLYLKEHGPSLASQIAHAHGLTGQQIVSHLQAMKARKEITSYLPPRRKKGFQKVLIWSLPSQLPRPEERGIEFLK